MNSKNCGENNEKFKSKIGGQAVIEGVMMRGIDKAAMACRLPDGELIWKSGRLREEKRFHGIAKFHLSEVYLILSYL